MDKIEPPQPGAFLAHAAAQGYRDFITPVQPPVKNPKRTEAEPWPFLKGSGKRALLDRWPAHVMSHEEVAAHDRKGNSVGLVARNASDGTFALWAIDADEDDQTASDALLARLVEWFREQGVSTIYIRRAGTSPRFALLLRIPEAFKAKPPKRGKCEFGFAGWQLASLGQHPNGEWRTWYCIDTATGTCEATQDMPTCADLPLLTNAQCGELMQLCGPMNSNAGLGKRKGAPAPPLPAEDKHRGQIAARPLPPAQQKALAAPRQEPVRLILTALPNDYDYNKWIGCLIVIIGAVRDWPREAARALVLAWCSKYLRTKPIVDRQKFEYHWRLRKRITVGYPELLNMAAPRLGGYEGMRALGLTVEDLLIREIFGNEPDKPVIRVSGRLLHDLVGETVAALKAVSAPVFGQGGRMVHPLPAADGAGQLERLDRQGLRLLLGRFIGFEAIRGKAANASPCDPPMELVDALLSGPALAGLPQIRGLLECPSLRRDGALIATPGYDAVTGYFLTRDVPGVSVSDQPTRQEAEAAVAMALDLLAEFPFVNPAGRSATLACMLHTCIRPLIDVVPMLVVTSPSPRTGKSYLLATACAPALGRRVPSMSATKDAAEFDKRLAAALLTGQPVIHLDNVETRMASPLLAQAIENPEITLRPLGSSEPARVANSYSIIANGNNVRVSGDLPARCLYVELDAGQERPEQRQFSGNPLAKILADRGRVLSALLTMLRWGMQEAARNGPLAGCTPLASFGQWSRLVRETLIRLNLPDPVSTQVRLRAASDDLEEEDARAFAILAQATGGNAHTVHELLAIIAGIGGEDGDTVRALATPPGPPRGPDFRTLGYWLRKHRNQIKDGVELTADDPSSNKNGRRWWFSVC